MLFLRYVTNMSESLRPPVMGFYVCGWHEDVQGSRDRRGLAGTAEGPGSSAVVGEVAAAIQHQQCKVVHIGRGNVQRQYNMR